MGSAYQYRLFKTALAARLERFRLQRSLRYAVSALVVSSSVQLGLLPLLVLYFHRVSLASLILNIVVGMLMAVLCLFALAALLLFQVSEGLAAPLFRLAEWTNWLMIHSVDPFTSARVASLRLPEYTGWAAGLYVLYYLPLLMLIFALARWRPLRLVNALDEAAHARWLRPRVAALALLVLLCVILAHPLSAGRPTGQAAR